MTERYTGGADPSTAAVLEEDAQDLYEHAPCGYVSLVSNGVIGKVNSTFLEWTGFRHDDIVGLRRFQDLLTIGGRVFYETHFQPLLRMQGFVREIAFELVGHSGERFPVLVNARQREYPDAGVITRIIVFDATDRRRYERELLEARRGAEEAARQKSELLAMISHDVRAPLSAIATAASLLDRTSPTPQQEKYLRVLKSSAAHALEVVTSALDLTRLDSGRPHVREGPFDLRALVDEIVVPARAAASAKAGLDLHVSLDPRIPPVLVGDRAKIAQILANLLSNAVKFTDRGFVSLATTVRDETPDMVVLDVTVSDSGIGIPADRLPYIFDEFTQASDEIGEKYGGTGLGLAITRRLLQLHKAEVTVSSTVGQGTTFSFPLRLKVKTP